MGKHTVKFKCRHCLHCCTDLVALPTPWDVIRIAKATGEHPRKFVEFLPSDEVDEVEKKDPTWLKCHGERFIMALKRHPKRGCYFVTRKKGKCKIYEVRPILCRLFPFKLQESRSGKFRGFTLHKDVACPRHRGDIVETAPLYALWQDESKHQDDYHVLVRVFNRKRYKGKKPEDFLDMFYADGRPARGA